MTSNTIILSVLLAISCLILPRRYFALPFIVAACMVPMNQRMFIGGLDFTVLRILVFVGMLRVVVRGETQAIRWNGFDKLVLLWNLSSTIIYSLKWLTVGAFLNRCGVMYDSLGIYWLFRQFFRSFDDLIQVFKIFAICAILSAPFTLMEKYNKSSIYSYFGPVGSAFHHGRFRCAGPFPHYIMLGCFWASTIPFFYASWKIAISKKLNIFGILCGLTLVVLSASSTPLLTLISMCAFWMCYNYRMHGKIMLIGVCMMLTALHIVMNNPVWHLLARANIFGGSTGWHRYHLFDQFIKHTSEWFLLGTKSTVHWGRGLGDVTNQYVLEAVRGGFITLCIFVVIIYSAIKISGRLSLETADQKVKWISWGVCVSLLGHMVSFWGVSYFGQMLILLYITFAIVGFFEESKKRAE